MAVIIIAYELATVDGSTVRIYKDDTEKYFADIDTQDAKDYYQYLSDKGYTVDFSSINILNQGDFDVTTLYRERALSKLTAKEKEVLGVS